MNFGIWKIEREAIMSTMTEYRYIVTTPDEWGWQVTVTDAGVTYTDGQATYYWSDEDEVVDAIESGLVDDEQWRSEHNAWE